MENNVQGILAADPDEWVAGIIRLIDDVELRKQMGLAGRRRVEERFSLHANLPKYLRAFDTATQKN